MLKVANEMLLHILHRSDRNSSIKIEEVFKGNTLADYEEFCHYNRGAFKDLQEIETTRSAVELACDYLTEISCNITDFLDTAAKNPLRFSISATDMRAAETLKDYVSAFAARDMHEDERRTVHEGRFVSHDQFMAIARMKNLHHKF